MYHDENKHIKNQTCEYCNQEFLMFDKIIFPKNCENYPKESNNSKFISVDQLDMTDVHQDERSGLNVYEGS